MIGQERIKEFVSNCEKNQNFPRFMILTGEEGSGRTVASEYITHAIGGYSLYPALTAECVREVIENCYKCDMPIVYVFRDADKMSVQAKNSLLKVTEEPPKQAYFIMTVEDSSTILPTLKSRAVEFAMEPYTNDELKYFTGNVAILTMAENPGQILTFSTINVDEFIAYCRKVLDNIGDVTGVNALKITNKFKCKEDDIGYEPALFFNCINFICFTEVMMENETVHPFNIQSKYFKTMGICTKYKRQLKIQGIRKDCLIDEWILEIRKIWKGE